MFYGLPLSWSWNWGVLIFFIGITGLYLCGWWRAQVHQRRLGEPAVSWLRSICFLSAMGLFAVVFFSPMNELARLHLFTLHMVQAVLLTTVCAPLVLAACPAIVLQPLNELPVLRVIFRALTRPVVASLIFNLTFLLWHAPRFYTMAMKSPTLYTLLLLSIFVTALLNWFPLIGSVRTARQMSYPVQMLYAFLDGQPVDIYAFILVFTGVPLYTQYMLPPELGITPFADQAIAGALLLIPGLVDLGVMSPMFFRWLGQIEEKTRQADLRRLAEAEEWEEVEDEEQQRA
ncbi:cytochrome c oxidase assembly protein [Tengunoibacter tsumagoiensis]|uniref:Cytochrome c oxidase assembly protein n=1 Tax=Tengunoibacter tsumagoiensis TaxID=2014871 RepID=A0A402A1T0_9CHLR|nr:cytochrome c oxidase assembly protein [Tengunoibacter tsumagoiensis]GCE13074.1 hypothetical protein KTT_29330 [Tengunoibacter tsumagoiensis]